MIFSAIVILSFLAINLLYAWNVFHSRHYLLKHKVINKNKKNAVILLIPMYQETKIVAQTFKYFYEVSRSCNVKVIFVTTELEGSVADNQTHLALRKLVGNKRSILLEHYSEAHGSKAHQLNMVMEKYKDQTDYFAVFDADSRPDVRGIQYVQGAVQRTDVFQMPSTYLPHPSNALASQTMAVFQTRWSYCFEIPRWLAWQSNPGDSHIMYTVGHGLFIQNSIRFSEKTIAEDLELGYRLAAQGATLSIVPFFDYALVPQRFITAVVQSSRWYYGELLAPAIFWRYATDARTKHRAAYGYHSIIRYVQILLWMLGPILVIVSLILALPNIYLFSLGLVVICLHWLLHLFICRYQHASYRSLLLMPVKLAVNGLGPMLCVIYILLDIMKMKEFRFVKTER